MTGRIVLATACWLLIGAGLIALVVAAGLNTPP